MTTRPEALRLADELDENWEYHSDRDSQAAAELRRLHNEILVYHDDRLKLSNEVDRLKAALGLIASLGHRPDDDPVAMRHSFDGYGWKYTDMGFGSGWKEWTLKQHPDAEPVYTTPPAAQRPFVGLTDEDVKDLCGEASSFGTSSWIRHIEAKLRSKNNG